MTQRARATIHIDLLVRQTVFLHRGHRDHSERFIDLVQVHFVRTPTVLLEQLADRTDRRGGELRRCLGEGRMADYACERRDAQPLRRRFAHHHQRRSAIRDRRRVRGGHRSGLAEGRLERGDFLEVRLERLLVAFDRHVALAALHLHGGDFPRKRAVFIGPLGALERLNGEGILRLTREVERRRAFLGEGAHQAAFFVRVLEAVVEHVVDHLTVAHAHAATRLRQQVRRIGHTFHPAGDDYIYRARGQHVVREHGRTHAGAAHLVHRRAAGGERQARAQSRLASRRLAEAGGQHAAHHHFIDLRRFETCALDGRFDRDRAKLRRGQRREVALKRRHRRAGDGNDHNRIGLVVTLCLTHVLAP